MRNHPKQFLSCIPGSNSGLGQNLDGLMFKDDAHFNWSWEALEACVTGECVSSLWNKKETAERRTLRRKFKRGYEANE